MTVAAVEIGPDYTLEQEAEAWRRAAAEKLDWQANRARKYRMYFDGEEPIPAILDTEEREAFRQFLRYAGANWTELIVVGVAERLDVVGFSFGTASDEAWRLWQANQMDSDAEMVQTDALITGQCPVMVELDDDNPMGVSITPEAPEQACVLYAPGNRRRREAGYKRYDEAPGQTVETLSRPDYIATWVGGGRPVDIAPNPAGSVGMFEVIPQPRIIGAPRSELKPALPIQDRINTTLFNRLVATDYGAFRQIWATGLRVQREQIGEDEASGEPIVRPVKPFDIGANRLLLNENPAGRFGSFTESSLAGYLNAVEQDVQQLAAITQTPPHYLLGQMINLSADAIKASEAGLVKKVSRRARHIGEAWEQILRHALGLIGHEGELEVTAEVQWADFETRSEAQRADALVKMRTLGVPLEILWERWGASPQEVARWKELADEEVRRGTAADANTPNTGTAGAGAGPTISTGAGSAAGTVSVTA